MKCLRCSLINPDGALRCDCGYDFAAKTMKESYVAADRKRREPQVSTAVRELGHGDIRAGMLWCALGIVVTVGGYAFADALQGTYVIAYGPVLYGLVRLSRGIDRVRSGIERPFWGTRRN